MKHEYYPAFVCAKCGEQYGRRPAGISTWHPDTCGVCGAQTMVTEPRDYGHLRDDWKERYSRTQTANAELRGRLQPVPLERQVGR